ncbi:MAG TPA: AlpA family phage regulatory protein [Candidatus Aquilonibacter sp.]|nr:AlpA family phage regulatory protein [Candidatus Aquilonibacter sp.]
MSFTLPNTPTVMLPLPVVMKRVNRSKSTIYADIAKGKFPKPIKLGLRSIGFIEAEIEAWLLARIEESR